MIDIHSHILPEIDDGSKDRVMTLDMLREAEKDGITEIVATPHFCRGYGETPYDEVKEMVENLNKIAAYEGININVNYGQEVYYSENMIEDYKNGIIGTINDSRYMLFELPMEKFESDVFDIIYELQVLGIVPILAHPERYKFIMEEPSFINKFVDEGILFQMNAGSIVGDFGTKVKKTAGILLENGIYNFIGSDAHNNTNRRANISEGIKLAIEKNKMYRDFFEESSIKLLKDGEIEFRGDKIKAKKSFMSFFR
ncbi:capsular biosynthesis protein [Clostridium sp. SHJSY1]|uniref:tyrosine-protein phosphatase n=1 Tax=Clostridium sp. SHJSY1 TaxID=2942483 RepID=UPI0028759D97|nr:CpsB/CapC family capsule biosynthesis tyrosine phosphatase [Clostridium sp. SHJSY1]MDS0526660.1 capsular biosynthesis protein [Clostridium sp. SHJSY1]